MITLREYALNATVDLRNLYERTQNELRDIDAQLDNHSTLTYSTLVRLSDKRWDTSAKLLMVSKQLEKAWAAAVAEYKAAA